MVLGLWRPQVYFFIYLSIVIDDSEMLCIWLKDRRLR